MLPAVAVALDVVHRRSDSQLWAVAVFLGIFGVSWLVFAWSVVAMFGPVFKIAEAVR